MNQDIKLCICPECKQLKENVESRRQNTRYVDDTKNYLVSCPECFEDREEYWADMWEMGVVIEEYDCIDCSGSGYVDNPLWRDDRDSVGIVCSTCKGEGVVIDYKTGGVK